MDRLARLFLCFILLSCITHESQAADLASTELASLIDKHVDARLQAEKIPAAEPATDAEFLRRVYLDLHGVVPNAEQAGQFLTSTDPERRTKLIDSLLADSRYGEYLGDLWQQQLMSPLADDRYVRADRLRAWLAEQFNTKSWDAIATELLTATGKIEQEPAVVYLIEGRLPRNVADLTDLTSRCFLGLRLSCAQCHDHPFVSWKQQDFWGMAAFFTQVQTPGKSKLVYQAGIKDYPELTLTSLKDGAPDGFLARAPTFLDGQEIPSDQGTTHRAALAAWMTSPKNPYFARAMANRIWCHLFGRGIVNPVDDMHAANPPTHPELLELLTQQFVASGFDHKYLTRAIVSSRAYQRTCKSGDQAAPQAELFGRWSVKVLTPGQLYDSLVVILGKPTSKAPRKNSGDARSEFIEFFSDNGEVNATAYRRGIPHVLRQMNSGQFAGPPLAALAERLVKPGLSEKDVADDLFLTILSRAPTADELKLFQETASKTGSLTTATRELAWALLMTSEFSLNH